MIVFLPNNLSYFTMKKHTLPLCSSPVSSSLALRSFPTPTQIQIASTPTVIEMLVHKHNFPLELASRVASELIHLKHAERADSVLSFLAESGFSNSQLVKLVKSRARFLSYSLEDRIKPNIEILRDVGLSSGEICRIISRNMSVLELSVEDNIVPSLALVKDLLGSDDELASVVKRSSRFLNANLGKTLVPNVEVLKSYGIPMERIRIILTAYPDCLTIKPEFMRRYAEKAKEMGIKPSSRSFIYAVSTIAKMSDEVWELKLQAFRDLGFSESDILAMFNKAPPVFYGSVRKINEVVELLLGTGKFNLSSIVDSPVSLAFSIEKRYKPRLRILEILEKRNLIEHWPNLRTIYKLSDDQFDEKFVVPYSDEVGMTMSSARGKRKKMKTLKK